MPTNPTPAAVKAAEAINEHIGEGLACSDEAFAHIIDTALAEERRAGDAILAWLEKQPESDPDDQSGYYAIAAYRSARGQK